MGFGGNQLFTNHQGSGTSFDDWSSSNDDTGSGNDDDFNTRNRSQDDKYLFPDNVQYGQTPLSGVPGLGQDYKFFYSQADLSALTSLPADMMAALQQGLVAGGFLNGDFQLGAWSEKVSNAYKNLLQFANVNGVQWQEALQLAINQGGNTESGFGASGAGGSGSQLPPLQIQLPNEDDTRKAFQNAALSLTDRADPDVIDRLTSQYLDYVRDLQEQDYAEQVSIAGGGAPRSTIEEPPTLETFAENRLNPREVVAANSRDAMEILLGSLGQLQPSQRTFGD